MKARPISCALAFLLFAGTGPTFSANPPRTTGEPNGTPAAGPFTGTAAASVSNSLLAGFAGDETPSVSGLSPGGTHFEPRPFPEDFFFRLPNQDGGSVVPFEAYNPALRELFVSNPDLNTVEVYSTVDGRHVGEFSVPGPAGLSFSPDGFELVIGTITPYIYFANPITRHITRQVAVPAPLLTNALDGSTLMPVMPYAMADGSIFLGMGVNTESSSTSYTLVEHLIRYDRANDTFVRDDPGVGEVLANPARSLDGKRLLVPGESTTSIELFLYTTEAQDYVASSGGILNSSITLAANRDGSEFACVQAVFAAEGFGTEVTFFGPNLQPQGQFTSTSQPGSAVFSRNGRYLYLTTVDTVTALDSQTAMPTGSIGFTVANQFGLQFFDVDESDHLFGTSGSGGVIILNASHLEASPPGPLPDFISGLEGDPSSGPLAGGTQVEFIPAIFGSGSADGISSSTEAYFGSVPAPLDVVAPYPGSSNGGNFLTATSPRASVPGPVSVVLTNANNDVVFLPDAFTYGPHLLRVAPNAASPQGGDVITIYFYGPIPTLNPADVHITIGGQAANSTSLQESGPSIGGYPEEAMSVVVPPGTPGWADITISTSDGSERLEHGFQYLKEEVNLPGGPFTFAVYDSTRDCFYLTGSGNTVAVFDAASRSFSQSLPSPASVSSGAILQGEALTPDASKLLVADAADRLVLIFDLVSGTSTTVSPMLPSDPSTTGFGSPQPVFVATAAQNRAFVSIQPCVSNPVREIDLTNLSVRARPDAASSCATYVPYPENGASSADGNTIIYAGNSGLEPAGSEYVWRYDASSDTFTGPVLIPDNPWVGAFSAAVDGDGGVIAVTEGTLDERLLPLVPSVGFGFDAWALNRTGSLIYSILNPFAPPTSVLISDSRDERQRLIIGLPAGSPSLLIAGATRPLAIDPFGRKILALTQYGVSYFELSVVPYAGGSVSPYEVSAGESITVHGSGFVAGTTVEIGGLAAFCTETDSETISCTVPSLPSGAAPMTLTNPDGQTFSIENALKVN